MKIAYLFEPTHPMTHYACERIRLRTSDGNDEFHIFTKQTPSPLNDILETFRALAEQREFTS